MAAQQAQQVAHQQERQLSPSKSMSPNTPHQLPVSKSSASPAAFLGGSPAPNGVARSDDPFSVDYFNGSSKEDDMNCFVNAQDLVWPPVDQDMPQQDLSYQQLLDDWSMPVAGTSPADHDSPLKGMHDLFSLGSGPLPTSQSGYSPWASTADPSSLNATLAAADMSTTIPQRHGLLEAKLLVELQRRISRPFRKLDTTSSPIEQL